MRGEPDHRWLLVPNGALLYEPQVLPARNYLSASPWSDGAFEAQLTEKHRELSQGGGSNLRQPAEGGGVTKRELRASSLSLSLLLYPYFQLHYFSHLSQLPHYLSNTHPGPFSARGVCWRRFPEERRISPLTRTVASSVPSARR